MTALSVQVFFSRPKQKTGVPTPRGSFGRLLRFLEVISKVIAPHSHPLCLNPGWIVMNNEALRGSGLRRRTSGYVERAGPKGNEVRRERQPDMASGRQVKRSGARSSSHEERRRTVGYVGARRGTGAKADGRLTRPPAIVRSVCAPPGVVRGAAVSPPSISAACPGTLCNWVPCRRRVGLCSI
jgi:hypothetical protein